MGAMFARPQANLALSYLVTGPFKFARHTVQVYRHDQEAPEFGYPILVLGTPVSLCMYFRARS